MEGKMILTLRLFKKIIQKCWSRETCYPPLQSQWTPKNPALGQCAVTVLVVQDYFGGEILYCSHYHHYWNKLPNGREVDFTRSQFPRGTAICVDGVALREQILTGEKAQKAATLERYKILKQRVDNYLSSVCNLLNKRGRK